MPLGCLQLVWWGSELHDRWPGGTISLRLKALMAEPSKLAARMWQWGQVSALWLILQRRNKYCICMSQLLPKSLAFESVNVNVLQLVWRRCCCYYIPTVNFPWAEFSMCTVSLLRSTNSWLLGSLKQLQMFQLCSSVCMCFHCVIAL